MTTIETNGRNLLIVEVPINAENIDIDAVLYSTLHWDVPYCNGEVMEGESMTISNYPGSVLIGTISYLNRQYVFDFDPTPFVEASRFYKGFWKCYTETSKPSAKSNQSPSPEDALLPLLQANGVYWVNPINKPDSQVLTWVELNNGKRRLSMADRFMYWESYLKWQEAEAKRLKGKLVVIEVK